jgi:hypothetical protein
VGLSAFYRYNFTREGAKGFPFAGAEISVADLVHRDFTGNVQVRPNVGYAYSLKKNVRLDFKDGCEPGFFLRFHTGAQPRR